MESEKYEVYIRMSSQVSWIFFWNFGKNLLITTITVVQPVMVNDQFQPG